MTSASEESRARAGERHGSGLARFKWVIGTPYFVQGTSNLTEVPILYFIKFTLGMGDAGGQLFDSLRSAGWLVKPLWGFISDRLPLFGYRRKSWFVLMAFLAMAFWALNALLALAGVRIPVLFLLTFNLAFATYAFVDVVCDALMVEHGRRYRRISSFVNLQWATLAVANAGAVLLGGWLQEKVQAGEFALWAIFLLTGLPPLATAAVGLRNIEEDRIHHARMRPPAGIGMADLVKRWSLSAARGIHAFPRRFRDFRRHNRIIWILTLFIFFWKFSPSVGYIERSYLIDVRGFDSVSFGLILGIGSITFLVSILAYIWVTNRFRAVGWDQYLYAMIALGVLSFPLSFYLYFDPGHPWWSLFDFRLPDEINPLPGWNRYQWFRLLTQTVLGFATIPAFIIPLTIAGEAVKIEYAGVGYAFLMSLSNVTNVFEGVVGAGLFAFFSKPWMAWLLESFQASALNVAGTSDERTLILQIFVYISLVFTFLTIPFLLLLRRALRAEGIEIRLGRPE